jgi:chromosome segregation ATPase
MKRIFLPSLVTLLFSAFVATAQTTAGPSGPSSQELQEKIERLSGDVERLTQENVALRNKISALADDLSKAREEASNKANANTGVQEDLKKLAEKIQEVDKKRIDDNQLIAEQIKKIGDIVTKNATTTVRHSRTEEKEVKNTESTTPQKGYTYEVQSGDNLSAIIAEYNKQFKSKGWKSITLAQVVKANDGLKPERMRVGQKIFIPMPAQAE